jgi:methylmalonyl-CoA mutase N-terminal domain/subunit
VLGHESGAANVTDPLGGSYLVEALTHQLMEDSRTLMRRVDDLGGAVAAIEAGFYQQQIQESAYRYQRQVESGERVIVGVNRFTETSQREVEILRIGAELEAAQIERLARVRAVRDGPPVSRALDALRRGAEGTDNLLPLMRDALDHHATVGEVCGALRDVFGVYHPQVAV